MRAPTRALSIRQPYAEQILRGTKKYEFRNRPCHVRERVYIYASLRPGDSNSFRRMKKEPGELSTGVLVGTVEITDCSQLSDGTYRWHLGKPKRLRKRLVPRKHPQPAWFRPF
jgi:hypothetical protein